MEERGFIEKTFRTIGQIVGLIIVWFFIGGGWNGLHDYYYRVIKEEYVDPDRGERVGYIAFYIWALSVIGMYVYIGETDTDSAMRALILYLIANTIFFFLTLFGFIYLLKNTKI